MSEDNASDVLSPDQLELDEEHVRPLEDDRYVVDSDGASHSPADTDATTAPRAGPEGGTATGALADLEGAYALELHARFETGRDEYCIDTNDVSQAFESLLRWYAGKVADDAPPEAVVGVLLENSDLDVAIDGY